MKHCAYGLFLFVFSAFLLSCQQKKALNTNTIKSVPVNSIDFNNCSSLYTHLKGKLGDEDIEMDLTYLAATKEFMVNYEKESTDEPIHLVASLINNRLHLKALNKMGGGASEYFCGSMAPDKSIHGLWTNGDSSKVLEFRISELYSKGSIALTMREMDTTFNFTDANQHSYTADYRYSYLQSPDPAINYIINSYLLETDDEILYGDDINKTLRAKLDHSYETFVAKTKELLDDEDTSYQYNLSFERGQFPEVIKNDASYLVIDLAAYSYSNGAHGTVYNSLICIDRSAGRRVTTSDLVSKYGKEKLLSAINRQIRIDNGLKEEQDFTENGDDLFVIDKVEEIPANFYLHKNGVVFIFNDYELKAYAAGHQTVSIANKDMKL